MLDCRRWPRALEAAARALFPDAGRRTSRSKRRAAPSSATSRPTSRSGSRKAARKKPPRSRARARSRARWKTPTCARRSPSVDAAAGFINLRLVPEFWQARDRDARCAKARLRPRRAAKGERISLEFGSANPTGPLVVVQGRTLSIGDDAGARRCASPATTCSPNGSSTTPARRLDTLARSLYARYMQLWDPAFPFPEEGYPGDYLVPIAERIRDTDGDRWRTAAEGEWLPYFANVRPRRASCANSKPSAARFGVRSTCGRARRRCTTPARSPPASSACATRPDLREGRRAVVAHDRVRRRQGPRGRALRRPAGVFRARRRLPLRQAAARRPRDRHPGARPSRLHRRACAALADAYGRSGAIEVLISQQITLNARRRDRLDVKRAGESSRWTISSTKSASTRRASSS